MGRPINKKFFANTNSPYQDQATGGPTGVGGEGIAAIIPLSTTTNYSTSTTVTWQAGVPTIPSGTRASGTVTVNTSGVATALTVLVPGSGYTTTATTLTFTPNPTTTGTFAISLTSSQQNGIAITAFVPGGSSGVIGDIMKQEASRRYLVKTAQGQGQCILVTTSTLAAGEMFMTAVDVTGASYFVDKLTARRARLYRYLDNGGTFEVADGGVSGWSLDAATTGTVQVVNN
jgi:hypothetical protein